MRALVALFALVGCGAGLPITTPDPMAIVWEGTYGMEVATRPVVSWHDECRLSANGGDRAITGYRGCVVAIVEANGAIELQRADVISASQFSAALAQWKRRLMQSAFEPVDGNEVARAQAALRSAGR